MSDSFDDQLRARVSAAAQRWSPGAVLQSCTTVTKGSSSLTYAAVLVDSDGQALDAYVKVAPPDLAPVRNRDVLRQAAVLDLLHRASAVPVPGVLFSDDGAPPEVPPFFVTAAVDGTCFEPLVDDDALPAASDLTARTQHACEVLARLHQVDGSSLRAREPVATGEHADLDHEVERWSRIFATLDRDGGDPAIPSLHEQAADCARQLRSSMPEPMTAVIVHGDFRLGNLVCDASRVRAVLDWEIWSLTDPRIDVAWLLMTLSAHGLPSAIRDHAPGLLAPEDALAVYERTAGAALTDLAWFGALSRFRAAAAMALNIKHNRRRRNPNPRIESYAARIPLFLASATARLA